MAFFSIADYVVFSLCLIISAGIGIYYRMTGGRQRTSQEYLLAGQSMNFLPVAFSLMASLMSAITLLGVSAEIYMYGIHFALINIAYLLATPIAAYIYLPVFYNLDITSVYQYLEKRFGSLVKYVASFTYILQMVLYVGIVLYAPALALAAVTSLSIEFSILSIGIVCAFYSTIGGMKAVLITDVFQSVLMFAAIWAIIIAGSLEIGGLGKIWRISNDGERIQPLNFDFDPTIRHTVWSLGIGGIFLYLSLYGVSQTQVQRLLTVSTVKNAQKALWIQWPILSTLSLSTCFAGLVIYAHYAKCDPIVTGQIQKPDQLMPLFVMETMSSVPGLPGLFISGLFSGSLSSISSTVNCLAAVCIEDYLMVAFSKSWTDKKKTYASKILVCAFSILAIVLAFVAKLLGNVLQVALTVFAVVGGPMLGLFSLGMFLRRATKLGALVGYIVGLVLCFWMGFGTPKPKPTAAPQCTDGCFQNSSLTANYTSFGNPLSEDYFYLYKISYMWYSAIGCLVTFILGVLFSLLQKQPAEKIPDSLIAWNVFKAHYELEYRISKGEFYGSFPRMLYTYGEVSLRPDTILKQS